MIRKFALIAIGTMISLGPCVAQVAPPPAKKAVPAPKVRVARPPIVAPELPDISIPEFTLPALPEIPELPALLDLPALPELPALPTLPDLSPLSIQLPAIAAQLDALSAGPLFALRDLSGLDSEQQEQAERARERAERDRERAAELKEREQERLDREEELYDDGMDYLDEGQWDRAAEKFAQVASMKGKKADAALYWKAKAQHKGGRSDSAVATINELRKNYPKSNYVKDADALEVEIRSGVRGGVSGGVQGGVGVGIQGGTKGGVSSGGPGAAGDEECELKLLALNSMQHQDPERAVPLLEKFLQTGSSTCPKLRKQALFVLAQSGSPRAREVIVRVARGQLVPELQREAINNLGLFGGHESRAELKSIYESSNDPSIKKKIIQSFMVAGEKEFLLTIARNEKDSSLRAAAVNQLGVMGAKDELWQMYQTETADDVKAKILNAMFVGGDVEHMVQLAKAEKDPDLRKKAINYLGLMGGKRTGDALVELYTNEKDLSVRKSALNAFFLQGNCTQLVQVARKESDQTLRREAVQKLSLMNCKEGTDFLMELLSKP